MNYLLDTNICIALIKRPEKILLEKLKEKNPSNIFLCSVVKAELIFGARNSMKVSENLSILENFFAPFISYFFDDNAAEIYGIQRTILTRSGCMIGNNDLMISSIALSKNLIVVTRNTNEFIRVAGLQIESW